MDELLAIYAPRLTAPLLLLQLQAEVNEAKSALRLYQTIKVSVEGSLEEVTHKLHEIGDYSQVSSPFSSTIKESSSVMSFLDTSMAYFFLS